MAPAVWDFRGMCGFFLPFLFSFANRYWLVLRLWNFENWIKNTWRSTHRNYYFWFCQYLKLKFSKHVLFSWNFLWIKFSYLIIWTYCKYILLKFVVHINYILILWHREKNIKNSIAKWEKIIMMLKHCKLKKKSLKNIIRGTFRLLITKQKKILKCFLKIHK